jgi:hypothetical protein
LIPVYPLLLIDLFPLNTIILLVFAYEAVSEIIGCGAHEALNAYEDEIDSDDVSAFDAVSGTFAAYDELIEDDAQDDDATDSGTVGCGAHEALTEYEEDIDIDAV